MTNWREFVGPVSASMEAILDHDVHLVVSCAGCGRSVRMTPAEAAEQIGVDCPLDQARDRFRCSWCGSRGRKLIDVRACSQDMAAQRRIFDAERQMRLWPEDPRSRIALEEARAEWARRRPRDSMDAMCNAFRLKTPIAQIALDLDRLNLPLRFQGGATPNDWPEIEMTRPTNTLPVFRPTDVMDPSTGLQLANKRWWLVPFFHRGETKAWKAMCTNARAETVATSRTFKGAFERRRCLVPADAYYEWTGEPGSKQRWRFERPDGDWWSFAGLWDRAETTEGMLESFAIVTTEAGPDAKDVHNRQPVILEKGDFGRWLDLSADVADLMRPSPARSLAVSAA
jgi:putative SOS response-associated peptidase YedK/DNA-directed RNA polymerase subunit RPC12/RpoP